MNDKLAVYCLDWHLSNSDAFRQLLEPLSEAVELELCSWDGEVLEDPIPPEKPTVFCQLPPSKAVLGSRRARLVWIPVWDQARIYPQRWWNSLPADLRVVALSDRVERRARAAGLPTLRLRYFADPAALPPAPWNGERIAFYWNRIGFFGPKEIERLCQRMSVTKLLFRDQLDPRIPRHRYYRLPPRLGQTEVIPVSAGTRDEFVSATKTANIYIAPRASEGVGFSIVEAMARGCCVVAYNAPAINEYIRNGENGLLFGRPGRFREARRGWPSPDVAPVSRASLRRFGRADHAQLGKQARLDHQVGHLGWLASIPEYKRFVFDW